MRESVGGTLLLQIVLVFLTVYIGFMAIVINYGRVFRYKNAIINAIEQNEGYGLCTDISTMVKRLGYNGDYVISATMTEKGAIYSVKVYIDFQVPLVRTKLSIPISGETRLVDTVFTDKLDDDFTCTQKDY